MATEVEVVEVAAAKALLPNLTICVDKDDENNTVLDIEYESKQCNVDEDVKKNDEVNVQLKPTLFPRQKLYKNSKLAGIESLGISFEEAKAKRQERANRFKSPLVQPDAVDNVCTEDIEKRALHLIKEVKEYNSNQHDDSRIIRPEALHIHGVDKMSTEDIFSFCGSSLPSHIEWINDTSCNILWNDELSAAKALETIAPLPTTPQEQDSMPKDITTDDVDDFDLEDEAMEVDGGNNKPTTEPLPKVTIRSLFTNAFRKCPDPYIKKGKNTKHELSLRFAQVGDKKETFAAKKSRYYRDYGNPHYNGAKGILSSSFRKRFQMRKARNELRDLNVMVDVETSTDKLDARAQRFNTVSVLKRDSESIPKAPKTEKQKDDDHLMKSSANELADAVRVYSSGDDSDNDYGTMIADQIERNLKTARHKPGEGELRITTSNSNVKSRLGQRPLSQSIKEEHGSMVSDNVELLHPTDLRNRLGKKRPTASSFFKSDYSDTKRRRRGSSDDDKEELETLIRMERSRNAPQSERYLDGGRLKSSSGRYRSEKSSRHERRDESPRRTHKHKSTNPSRKSSPHQSKMKSSVHKHTKSKRQTRDQAENSNGRTLVRYSPSPFDD